MKQKKARFRKMKRCWEFFQCPIDKHKVCLLADTDEWRCWLIDIACCKMSKDVPQPLSVKKIICKNCEYYKTYKDAK